MQAIEIDRQTLSSRKKASLRAEAAALRKQAWTGKGASAGHVLARRGLSFMDAITAAAAVAGYYPIRFELDPLPLLHALHKKGHTIVLPVAQPGPALTFRGWIPGEPLELGKHGLKQPGGTCREVVPSIVLVPLLAFDRAGNRLGYGAGYYDVALRNLRRLGTMTAIGIGFDEQEFPELPREPQDEPLNYVLTPTRVIACGE